MSWRTCVVVKQIHPNQRRAYKRVECYTEHNDAFDYTLDENNQTVLSKIVVT